MQCQEMIKKMRPVSCDCIFNQYRLKKKKKSFSFKHIKAIQTRRLDTPPSGVLTEVSV